MDRRAHPCLAVALGLLVATGPAWAQDSADVVHEIKLGVLAHDVGGLWSGFNREDGVDINFEAILDPSWAVLGGALRPAFGVAVNTAGDTSKLYLDARWEYEWAAGPFVAIGLGAALHDGKLDDGHRDRKALGSRVLFHIPAELGYRFDRHHSLSAYFDHVSNAFLAKENDGMDTLGLRYGYRF